MVVVVVVFLDVVTVVSLVTEVVREVLPPSLVSPSPVSPSPVSPVRPEEISLLVLELSAPAAGTALPPPLDDDFLLDSAHENRHSFKHIIIFRPHKMAEENHDLCCVFFSKFCQISSISIFKLLDFFSYYQSVGSNLASA